MLMYFRYQISMYVNFVSTTFSLFYKYIDLYNRKTNKPLDVLFSEKIYL